MGTPTEQDIDIVQKYGIKYLYHMTSIHNLGSIIRHGLLSHNEAHKRNLVKKDISLQDVQDRRDDKKVLSHNLHDYVCLYFSPRNPMLFKRKEDQDEIIILCVSPTVLFFEDTIISDGNAASARTVFFSGVESLEEFPWKIINSHYWLDHDDGRRIKCAEVLVYPKIPTSLIMKIYCCNQRMKISCMKNVNQKIPVELNFSLYF